MRLRALDQEESCSKGKRFWAICTKEATEGEGRNAFGYLSYLGYLCARPVVVGDNDGARKKVGRSVGFVVFDRKGTDWQGHG